MDRAGCAEHEARKAAGPSRPSEVRGSVLSLFQQVSRTLALLAIVSYAPAAWRPGSAIRRG